MAFFRRSSVIGAVVAIGACSASSAPVNVLEVNVPTAVFERIGAPATATVPFTVINRGSSSVFVARCGDRVMAALDRWNGHSWVQYSGDACQANLITAGLELTPGSSATASRSVFEPGKYRLRIGATDAASGAFDWATVSRGLEVR
jgi:hypothetical protein